MPPAGNAPEPDHANPRAQSDSEAGDTTAGDTTADEFAPEDFEDETPDDGDHSALPPKLEAWRKRSATGAILTGFALGLQQVFEKEREQPAIIMTTSGDPPRDLPVEAEFEHGRPRQSVVSIRPWLLGEQAGPADPGGGSAAETSAPETSDAEDGGAGSEDT